MHEPLQIADISFMVRTLIERAPAWTMLRELVKNGIEAAERAAGDKTVHITSKPYKGVPKLVIWNTGPGLDDQEIKRVTDLSSSIGKQLDLDANFGVGAKISSLANNKLGMRYRSCKDSRVSEVILGYDEGTGNYVRFERRLPTGEKATVIDVTDAVRGEGTSTAFDWTEVMLLGNSVEQDTVRKPFVNEEPLAKGGIATALYRRFYRIPGDVKLKLDKEYHRFDNTRTFTPLSDRHDKFKRVQSVRDDELGLTITYFHDPAVGDKSGLRGSSRGALGSATTTLCLVHKDEMYSVVTGQAWTAQAPDFGIAFGAKELCVHIELDDDTARPTQYRERLISRETGKDIVPDDYALYVREFMPDWVKEVIATATPHHAADYSDLRKELQDLLDQYKVRITGRSVDLATGSPSDDSDVGNVFAGGDHGTGGGAGGGGTKPRQQNIHDVPEGAKATSSREVYERAPEIQELIEDEHILEHGLKGRAAKFVQNTGTLFVNGKYEAVERMVQAMLPELTGEGDAETVRTLAIQAARRSLCLRVGKATVFALAKRSAEDWNEDNMKIALSPESLSIAADNFSESITQAKRHVRTQLRTTIAEVEAA